MCLHVQRLCALTNKLSSFSFFPQMVTRTKKIFVGGLSANTVVEDVKQYFEQFGKVRTHPFFKLRFLTECCHHINHQ